MEKSYFFQIDALKAFAIISVILVHTLPTKFLLLTQAQFHIWQAVLIFIFLLGFNWGNSYARTDNFLIFITSRIKTLAVPIIVFNIISMFFQNNLSFDYALLLGTPPFRGAGSYFISLIIQFIIIIPIMVMIYKRVRGVYFLSIFFIFNFIVEFLSLYIFQSLPSIYYSSFSLRYIFVVALGIYFMDNKDSFFSLSFNKIGLLISLLYLVYWGYSPFYPSFILPVWNWQHLFSFFYTGAFVYIFIKYIPPIFNHPSIKLIAHASLHIFLFQILFFGLNGTKVVLGFIQDIGINKLYLLYTFSLLSVLLITVLSGILWYFIEKKISMEKMK